MNELRAHEQEFAAALRKAFEKYASAKCGDTVNSRDVVGIYSRDEIDLDGVIHVLELWDVLPLGRTGIRGYRLGEPPKQITYAD